MGKEGAKVLRELGQLVKTMTKLNSPNILAEVHHAAEELQKKIDQRSCLLVNTERWGEEAAASRRDEGVARDSEPPPPPPPEHAIVVNINGVHRSDSFASNSSSLARFNSVSAVATDFPLKPQASWPFRLPPFHPALPFEAAESRPYESASELSLATFASLLIEFVAWLRNLVDAFEELSHKAGFKDPVSREGGGLLGRIQKFFRPKS